MITCNVADKLVDNVFHLNNSNGEHDEGVNEISILA